MNIIGDIHFFLPEVFTNNNTNVVNSNLSNLPFELQCYIVMSFMIVTGIIYRRKILSIMFVGGDVYSSLCKHCMIGFQVVPAQVEGPVLVYYFIVGVLMFLWRDKIMFHEGFFLVSVGLCYVLMMSPKTVFIYPLLLTYITVFIGLFPFSEIFSDQVWRLLLRDLSLRLPGYPGTLRRITVVRLFHPGKYRGLRSTGGTCDRCFCCTLVAWR